MRSVELFAGAGGLAIGMANAGFQHAAVIEWNADACETFRENQRHHTRRVEEWPLHEADVRAFDYGKLSCEVVVVSGGPPCQPFSVGGKHRGQTDGRDMFPEAVRAVRELRPKAFIFENVKGLKRETFATYFEYIRLQLTFPSLVRLKTESWREHCRRLERHQTLGGVREYKVVAELLNAADFGVPQRRERVFIVGFREDIGRNGAFRRKPIRTRSSCAQNGSPANTGSGTRSRNNTAPGWRIAIWRASKSSGMANYLGTEGHPGSRCGTRSAICPIRSSS